MTLRKKIAEPIIHDDRPAIFIRTKTILLIPLLLRPIDQAAEH